MQNRFVGSARIKLIFVTIILIIAILGISSLFNRTDKVMDFEPLNWHVMGEKAHMSFRMKPDSKGQTFKLDVWLPTGMGEPESVSVQLEQQSEEKSQIELPMKLLSGGPDPYGFKGFDKYTFSAKDNIFTEEGKWSISIVITDSKGQVFQYEKSIAVTLSA